MSEIKKPEDFKKAEPKANEVEKPQVPVVTHKDVTINGVTYPTPEMDMLDRAAVKRIRALGEEAEKGDPDALWEMAGALLTDTPSEDIDRLRVADVKAILSAAGMMQFTGDDAYNPEHLTITLGESLASTDS